MSTDLTNLTIAQLTSHWNQRVNHAQSIGVTGYKPINSKFKDSATALRRIEDLESSIRAREASERVVEQEAVTVDIPAEPQQEDSEVARSKKSKKTRQKAATARTRASRATNGADSISGKTQKFNDLVPEAKRLGVPARHHSSLFGSHAAADKMLKKLEADMAAARRSR